MAGAIPRSWAWWTTSRHLIGLPKVLHNVNRLLGESFREFHMYIMNIIVMNRILFLT